MTKEEKRKYAMVMEIRKKREKKRLELQRKRKRHRIAAGIAALALFSVTLGIAYNASAVDVTITEINEFTGLVESQTVRTRGGNVEDVLKEHGLDIGEEDRLNVSPSKPVTDNDDIVITRGKRVTIKAAGAESVVTVTKADAADALVEAGYIPGEFDNITSEGDTIELVSVSHVDESVRETIERDVEYVDDPDLPEGQERVVDEGEDGIKEIQHKVTYLNGKESERLVTGENIESEPRNKVIARGTYVPTPAPTVYVQPSSSSSQSSSGQSSDNISKSSANDDGNTINGYSYSRKISMTATAYTTDPSENGGYGVSAMGNTLKYGIVAVDPRIVPLGSKVYVAAPDGSWSYGVASAEDTGGGIKGNRIDVCIPSKSDAMAFGRRSCVVYVLD